MRRSEICFVVLSTGFSSTVTLNTRTGCIAIPYHLQLFRNVYQKDTTLFYIVWGTAQLTINFSPICLLLVRDSNHLPDHQKQKYLPLTRLSVLTYNTDPVLYGNLKPSSGIMAVTILESSLVHFKMKFPFQHYTKFDFPNCGLQFQAWYTALLF